MRRDLGDFQTPLPLVAAVLECLTREGSAWTRVLEPTCGEGNFLRGVLQLPTPPREIRGIELQPPYVRQAAGISRSSVDTHVSICQANIFDLNLRRDLQWELEGPLLVVGNPPWVTNAELGALASANVPRKANVKALRGLDAVTGAANFDIAEYIWIKLIRELASQQPTIALLCKTAVARNVLTFAAKAGLPVSRASIHHIDARRWFGAAVDACLFRVDIRAGLSSYRADVYRDLGDTEPEATIGIVGGQLVANLAQYDRLGFADGVSPLTWRQGIKHDAASAVELFRDVHDHLSNKLGERVEVEHDFVYPLVKGTDLYHGRASATRRAILLPQRQLHEDTGALRHIAPRLWAYLTAHAEVFNRRKSSIYRNQPAFAFFGIGEYSFAHYKVGISGLHKEPRFHLMGPISGRPVMLDDTCYFVPLSSARQAAVLTALLNHPVTLDVIQGMMFRDAKRPVTKTLLQRLDLVALIRTIDQDALLHHAEMVLESLPEQDDHDDNLWPDGLEAFVLNGPLELKQPVQASLF